MIAAGQHSGTTSTVVLIDPRLGPVIPLTAIPALRSATAVYLGTDLPAEFAEPLSAHRADPVAEVLEVAKSGTVVLVTGRLAEPAAEALRAGGATVLQTPSPSGAALLTAVAIMDQQYSPGGCAWSAQQTHESLRRYLLEESYELLEAIDSGNRDALRSELADVLLQVLFHARVAASHEVDPFDIDTVATALVEKQIARRPHAFSDRFDRIDADEASRQWEERKRQEKGWDSAIAGVVLNQPAVALAAKLAKRAHQAHIPTELWPGGNEVGAALFKVAAQAELAGNSPELALLGVARQFMAAIRSAEQDAARAGLDPRTLTADEWRAFWPADNP